MSSSIIADHIRTALPHTDDPVISYLSGYISSTLSLETPVHAMLLSAQVAPVSEQTRAVIDTLIRVLAEHLLSYQLAAEEKKALSSAQLQRRLDRVVDMHLPASTGGAAVGSTDISSTNKAQASRVDLSKLRKQEAKIALKLSKKAATFGAAQLYKSSKLLDESYEDMFMRVNPLVEGAKGKNKDIHLTNIEVSFASKRILAGAVLTLAAGRRYGLIGRNGVGKSSLLRAMALREVPVPAHVSILYVEQEIVGDSTSALDSVLAADVWRHRLLRDEQELNAKLSELEKLEGDEHIKERDELTEKLGETQTKLQEMEAEMGPARAAGLLAGLGFTDENQKQPTSSFSGGWRMRLALARALFVKPDLLMLDEPSNMLDLNAIAWLEDYLQTWPNTLLVVSHDRAFLDNVATDIVHQHSERLDYYKGNFTQFYATRSDRQKSARKEYDSQMEYRAHLQAFIDRWRFNANRAAQAQSKIKVLEKLPVLTPPEKEDVESFKFPDAEKISPPLLQLDNVTFGYTPEKILLRKVDLDVSMDSRIAIIGANGAGKSTLLKLLLGKVSPLTGLNNRNGRLRVAYFAQHHVDALDLTMSPVGFLTSQFPGRTPEEYRSFLGSFGLTGTIGLQIIGTLSGGQKSRLAFAMLAMQKPHVLLLDEPTNHLDMEGLDALMQALKAWNGGVILISHDERFITAVSNELWVCADGTVSKFYGDVNAYKSLIVSNVNKMKP